VQYTTRLAQQLRFTLEVQHHEPMTSKGPAPDTHEVMAAAHEPGEVGVADRAVVRVAVVDGSEPNERRITEQRGHPVLSSICATFRVLVLPAWYPWPDRPGLGTFCRDQAEAVSLLHDVIVVTWRRNAALNRWFVVTEAVENGLRTVRIQVRPLRRPRLETLVTTLAVVTVLVRLIRSGWRAEVVHAHEFQIGVPGNVVAAVCRAPLVVSEHWSALARGELSQAETARARRFFRRAAVVSPVSHDMAERIASLVDGTTLRPVPNPVDTRLFAPATRDACATPATRDSEIRLLSVGNLVAIKGHALLIDALPRLLESHPTVRLDVVGDGDLRYELERRAHDHGVASHVRFHGRVERRRVAELMRSADVLVLPSLWENLPCVLLEAMSSGLPVVATRVGGTAEIVDASNGQLVDPGSAAGLAEGIARVLDDRDRFDPEAMHRAAEGRYGYEAVARTWTEVYEAATRAG
jgi:glycosyltransferase involved in cell wall biosynthesis